uniref:Uncharacterized protein n=1 Tax=Acrobeloides nanus TaxID=290746 RepID=A0A914D9K7_9BILA
MELVDWGFGLWYHPWRMKFERDRSRCSAMAWASVLWLGISPGGLKIDLEKVCSGIDLGISPGRGSDIDFDSLARDQPRGLGIDLREWGPCIGLDSVTRNQS